MKNPLFLRVTCDYYVRCYEIDSQRFNGLPVTIYAECSPNVEKINNEYYYLEVYYSVNEIAVRDFLIGVTFGKEKMEKEKLDEEVDRWVNQLINEETFPETLQEFLRKEQMWEDVLNRELENPQ